MAFDMRQFLKTFLEESFEGLDVMENALLNMDVGAVDGETINTIFRAAHSIKGGSGTFGLQDVAHFTHGVETLLDEMRDGRRSVTQPMVDLLLSSVDVLREMLAAHRDQSQYDEAKVRAVADRIQRELGQSGAAASDPAAQQPAGPTAGSHFTVHFRPKPHLLKTGNEPLRMLRELATFGELTTVCDISALPALVDMDPEEIYLGWELRLQGDATAAQVKEVFEWVEDDCDLRIEEHAHSASPNAAPAPTANREPAASTEARGQPALHLAPPADERREDERRAAGDRRKVALTQDAGSIRVGIDKVDALINMVGELVITQSMLNQLGEDFDMSKLVKLQEGLSQLERNTRELQESVMRIRMLPISFAFNRFPRMVHDLSTKLGKKVELQLSGEGTELDKTVMEKIGDPLVHLVRNSLDHGIETPQARLAAGKPEMGTIHLNAFHQGGNIVIEISDDGGGLPADKILAKARERGLIGPEEALTDEKIYDLIFQPGFSTAEQVSDVSGRGVGMDVVRRNIKDLGGSVEVQSWPGKGSKFTIRLPLTLAILDGQLVRVGQETYILPLVSIIESLQIRAEHINVVAGKAEVYKLRDEYLPIVRLYQLFGQQRERVELVGGLLVVVEGDGQRVGLLVDDLLSQQQVVIKSLETNFKKIGGVAGATILGDGTVSLILDITGIISWSRKQAEDTGKSSGRRKTAA